MPCSLIRLFFTITIKRIEVKRELKGRTKRRAKTESFPDSVVIVSVFPSVTPHRLSVHYDITWLQHTKYNRTHNSAFKTVLQSLLHSSLYQILVLLTPYCPVSFYIPSYSIPSPIPLPHSDKDSPLPQHTLFSHPHSACSFYAQSCIRPPSTHNASSYALEKSSEKAVAPSSKTKG